MGHPGLLQEPPHLLSERRGDREQAVSKEPTGSGLVAKADLAVNHRRTQRPFRCIVRSLGGGAEDSVPFG